MKRELCIITAALLLLTWGCVWPCRSAVVPVNDPIAASVEKEFEKPKESEAGSKPKPKAGVEKPSTANAEKPCDDTSDPLGLATHELTSFFNYQEIVKLWNQNSALAWFMLLLWIFIGLATGKICSLLLRKAGSRDWAVPTKFLLDLAGPANLFLIALGLMFGLLWIQMTDNLKTFAFRTLLLMFYIAFFWYVYNLISIVDVTFQRIGRKMESSLATHVAPLIRRTLRVFLIVIAAMFIVQSVFKQDIGAWLAGLGIAGLAVSLAAQDSLKNLFGSITIIMDRSFKIGERIICSGCDGVIEDIGLRTTRVRTAGGHVISIPNANIVNSPIENVSRRPAIQRNFTLTLKLDTPSDKVKLALKIINNILEDREIREPIHPTIDGKISPPRVCFNDYKPNGLILNITYWFAPPNNNQFLAHAEKINLRILEEFNKAEIILASA
jgi:MscS family membrane protein